MILRFEVPGEPKAKGRHRTTKSGINYTPQETVNYENRVKHCFLLERRGRVLEGPIRAIIIACFGIPKSYSKKKLKEIEEGKLRPTKKPDSDNIAKSILDSLNGIAYKDDSAVVELSVSKIFSEEPKVIVVLQEVQDGSSYS